MARPSDYRHGYRKNTRNRQKKENKFYTKPNNGGILNKRMPGIDEIKQNIDKAQLRAQEYENEWLDSVVNNSDERQMNAAKVRAQEAKSSVKSWNEKLSEAYGLGDDGYWNRGTQQPITQQSEKMREHPEHAYGIGQYSPTAEQPKPAAISSAAGSAKGRQIMQLQDTLVHNPGMSAREKSQVQEKINNLTADKEVLDWKDANPGRPTQENYQTQIDYYNRLITQAQDDMVNALGSGNVSTGDDKWYEYHDKVDELVKQRDAYNRGMMGQLDGDKAQTAEEATATAGGGRSVTLDANDGAVYTGQPGMDDEEGDKEDAKKIVNDTYNEILGMDYNERVEFINSDSALEYFGNLENIKKYLSDEEILAYRKALFGTEVPYEVSNDGNIIVKTSPFLNETMQEYIANIKETYYDSIGGAIDPYNNMIYALANAEPNSNLLVEYAKTFVDELEYKWGGNDLTSGADCAGFVESIYKDFGYEIPAWNAQAIVNYADNNGGTVITGPGADDSSDGVIPFSGTKEKAQTKIEEFCDGLKPGDLILFDLGNPEPDSEKKEDGMIKTAVDHVVMYAGNGMIVEAYDNNTKVYYRSIEDLIFKEAGGENSEWTERMPLVAVRYLTEEQQARLTVQGVA